MITVHHLNNSRSQRIIWLLEELGVPYEIKRYERDGKTMLAPPELKAIHRLGKSPVITDGDVTVAESGAIIEYLVEQYSHGKLAPAAVRVTGLLPRSIRGVPAQTSSALMRRPKAGWVTLRSSAARLKLRVCANATKSSSHLSCMSLSRARPVARPASGWLHGALLRQNRRPTMRK